MSPVAKGHVFQTLEQRFEAKVERTESCWLWRGFVDKAGYGRMRVGGRDEPVGYAHRIAFELYVGTIPAGLTVDHRCHDESCSDVGPDCLHRRCVNPDHLAAVPHVDNFLRGNHPWVARGRALRREAASS